MCEYEYKISIIIPVYNVEKYIKKCLDSILCQQFNYEIICVDDGSVDCSKEILYQYAKADSRVRVLESEHNYGPSHARNIGLYAAKGEYIWFVDSDDTIFEDSLNTLYNVVKEEKYDFITFGAEYAYENSEIKQKHDRGSSKYTAHNVKPCTGIELLQQLVDKEELVVADAWRYIFRHEFLVDNNLHFKENIICEDVLFVGMCFLLAKRVNVLDGVYYTYFRRENSIMTSEGFEAKAKNFFICFYEFLKYLMNCDDVQTKVAGLQIEDFLQSYIFQMLESVEQTIEFSDEIMQYLFSNLFGGSMNLSIPDNMKERLCQSNEKKYIYGAGIYARQVLEYFHRLDLSVDGVIVTHKTKNTFMGHKIMEISSFDTKQEDVSIFVAIKGENGRLVKEELKEMGLKHII